MFRLDPRTTAAIAIDMHRGHLDPAVATLPLPAERCGPVIKRAAALFDSLRLRAVPVDSMDGEEMHGFALRLMAAAIGWPLDNDEILEALEG